MKKKILFVCLIIFLCLVILPLKLDAKIYADNYTAGSPQYARVKGSNVKLYKTPAAIEDYSNFYFTIPESYFVELLDYENENYFSARYLDCYGYVKISEVQCVSGVPQNPFVTKASFRVFAPNGLELRSSPSQSDGLNVIANINYLETNLQYYGKIDGEEAIAYKGNEWYFCKYTKNGQEQKGYIYSVFCDLLTTISTNTEILEYVSEPTFATKETNAPAETDTSLSSLPSTTQILIIVAVCVPCVLIIYLLFRPTRITARAYQNAEEKSAKRKKHSRKQDYYELEE